MSSSSVERPIDPIAFAPTPPAPTGGLIIGGALPQLFRSEQPLQLINPFAPASYGDGTANLAINPLTGQAEGVTFLSFSIPAKPKGKKARASKVGAPPVSAPPSR